MGDRIRRVRLIHWHAGEAEERAERLRAAGYEVDALPEGAVLRDAGRGPCDLVLWFATRREDVDRKIVRTSRLARDGELWVLWPKRSSGWECDLTQPIVRRAGLDRGLVDYEVVSVDETWTGLRFRLRR